MSTRNPRPTKPFTLPVALILALVGVLAIVASGALGGGGDPTPSNPPSGSPSASPEGSPSVSPTPTPSNPPSDGKIRFPLDNVTDHDVSIVIDDVTGDLVRARSGKPGEDMSVRWYDSKVENSGGPETIKVTWVGLPLDDEVLLRIAKVRGKYAIEIVQKGPPAYSDALGSDRILYLEFKNVVAPADIVVTIKDA